MSSYRFAIVGAPEFAEKMRRLTDSLSEDDIVSRVYLAAAKVIAASAKRMAPTGKHPAFSSFGRVRYQKYPGRLKKAIVAAQWRPDVIRQYGPGAYAQVNLKRARGVTAPYGHIVAGGRKPSAAKRHFFWREGMGAREFVKARRVKGFAGRNYFQRAVAANAQRVLDRATAAVKRQIEKGRL